MFNKNFFYFHLFYRLHYHQTISFHSNYYLLTSSVRVKKTFINCNFFPDEQETLSNKELIVT